MSEQTGRRGGKKGRKIGRQKRKPSHMRYTQYNRRAEHKDRRVLKSSHGKWTYKKLLKHQAKLIAQGGTGC